jgi:folate-binding protein YgfZ
MWALKGEERVGLLVDVGRGAMLAEDLGYYRIRVKAEVRLDDRSIDLLWGDSEAGPPEWSDDDGGLTGRLVGRGIARSFSTREPGEARVLSDEDATRWRVLAGEPVMDVDVDESIIPQETGLVDEAVSFTKGCYLGQELVARIDTRGRVNKRLCGLSIPAGVVPPDGTELSSGDRVVGTLTSAVRMGEEILALAMVRREVEAGDSVAVDGIESRALICELPFSSG